MAFNYSPKIVTNGLVLCLDAGNIKSFVSGSTVWNDLTKNNYIIESVKSPSSRDQKFIRDACASKTSRSRVKVSYYIPKKMLDCILNDYLKK